MWWMIDQSQFPEEKHDKRDKYTWKSKIMTMNDTTKSILGREKHDERDEYTFKTHGKPFAM